MRRLLILLPALLLLGSTTMRAEMRTLTDQFGRSITANVLELDGDTLKIRRDDGIVFDLPIGNLSIEDQKAIREWSAKQPKKVEAEFEPDPTRLPVTYSRVKLKSTTLTQYEASYKYVSELWGYSIQLTNKQLRPVGDLRVEYNIFAKNIYYISRSGPITGSVKFETLRTNESDNVKTKGVEIRKEKSTYWGNNGGELDGIWFRVYYKDKLVHEVISPESLKDSETWHKIEK